LRTKKGRRKKEILLLGSEPSQGKDNKREKFHTGATFIEMTFIPRGRFCMGNFKRTVGKDNKLPRRAISIHIFLVGKTEITMKNSAPFFLITILKKGIHSTGRQQPPVVKVNGISPRLLPDVD
jgi:hypothetical protein